MVCPKCSHLLWRRFSLLEKLALFLPLPCVRTCVLECEGCGKRYVASTGLTGYVLTAAFSLCICGLGDYWWASLCFLAAWVAMSYARSGSSPSGSLGAGHMLTGGILVGVLACGALVYRGLLGAPERELGSYCFLFVVSGIGFGVVMMVVDWLAPPRILAEKGAATQ